MITIIENGLTDISYTVQQIVDDVIKNEYTVKCKATCIEKNGTTYFVLFDDSYSIILDVFQYLNTYMKDNTVQTRQQSLVALKYLYSYCTLFSVDVVHMTKQESTALIDFLLGRSRAGADVSFKFNKVRSVSSVNNYLMCIRSYLKYLGVRRHPLLEKQGKKKLLNNYQSTGYATSLRTMSRRHIPAYISQDEFVRMVQKCREKDDLRMECIIRLMYQSGLRIGEVLGLTFEDIIEENGLCKVIIRNRFTDKTFQKAKFLMTITDKKQYKSVDYDREWYGWNKMAITPDMYECLMDYIDQAHTPEMAEHYEQWKNRVKTDIVSDTFKERDNFYVFINSHHTPLSNKTLEKEIRKLFMECGVPLNAGGGKTDGLAHRFRHGFAMYQVTVNKVDKLILSKLMRHRSIDSCEVYYNPEISEIIRIKDDISETVYDLLPSFELNE